MTEASLNFIRVRLALWSARLTQSTNVQVRTLRQCCINQPNVGKLLQGVKPGGSCVLNTFEWQMGKFACFSNKIAVQTYSM